MRSLRELFSRMGQADGKCRHALRSFNMFNTGDRRPKSVKDLANDLGIDVDQEPLAHGVSGYLEQDSFSHSGYRIVVNNRLPITRQRWAVLHEIGHYLLHRRTDQPFNVAFLDRSDSAFYESTAEEREADEVAATLLFGDGALEAAVSQHGRNLEILARRFGVTTRVIEIAMKQFVRQEEKRV